MQHRYQATPLSRHPAAARAVRGLLAAGIAGLVAFAWAGAGNGNGWQAPRERVQVTLPTVTVVGQRDVLLANGHRAVTCERPSAQAPRAAGKTA